MDFPLISIPHVRLISCLPGLKTFRVRRDFPGSSGLAQLSPLQIRNRRLGKLYTLGHMAYKWYIWEQNKGILNTYKWCSFQYRFLFDFFVFLSVHLIYMKINYCFLLFSAFSKTMCPFCSQGYSGYHTRSTRIVSSYFSRPFREKVGEQLQS